VRWLRAGLDALAARGAESADARRRGAGVAPCAWVGSVQWGEQV
jgi:hypothetical protein